MTKPYSLAFKKNVVKEYRLFLDKGMISVKGIEIKNINELIEVFGITKYSLYSWAAKFDVDYENGDENSDEFLDYPKDIESPGEKKETPGIEFGTRFWQFVAKNMGIKNYAMPLKHLKLKIGMELINGTGLVETNVKKEMRLK